MQHEQTMATADEAGLRAAKEPWPETIEALTAFVEMMTTRPHDYGTCVYAMSLAALASFNFVADKLGVTGFQASCADMDFIRRRRSMERGVLLNFENVLYPQYDLRRQLDEALDNAKPWLAEQAREKLANDQGTAHPDVVAHWRRLADEVAS